MGKGFTRKFFGGGPEEIIAFPEDRKIASQRPYLKRKKGRWVAISLLELIADVGVGGSLTITEGSPDSSDVGATEDLQYDDFYLYIYLGLVDGWARIPIERDYGVGGSLFTITPGSPLSNAAGTPGNLEYDAFYLYTSLLSGDWGRIPIERSYGVGGGGAGGGAANSITSGSPSSNAAGTPTARQYDTFYLYTCLFSGDWARQPIERNYGVGGGGVGGGGGMSSLAAGSPSSNAPGTPGARQYDAFELFTCLLSGDWGRQTIERNY